ncbi:MAG: PIN domain-containing protein [Acidobacteria bacterium]|nr:PIN domain-containing protein [Acidobacteriota bacterium]
MILADSSVWMNHLRTSNLRLRELLLELRILTHPFVVGEIACGNLRDRDRFLGSLQKLPAALVAGHKEALQMVNERRLWGRGIGWVDVHLLASALITGCRLWTFDRRLHEAARLLKVDYSG